MEVSVKDIGGGAKGTMSLPDEMFGIKGKEPLMHEAVVNLLANQRQGTHATKTKGLVSGGGKKPWKQKHTGRARAGSNRSPLWRHGGTTFGPQPRDYSYSMPRQAKKQALYAAISRKMQDGEVVVVDELKIEKPSTKAMVGILKSLELSKGSLLIVDGESDKTVFLSARNIPGVNYKKSVDLNAYDLLSHGKVLMTKAALKALETLGGGKGQ